jgi:hypothetical protein
MQNAGLRDSQITGGTVHPGHIKIKTAAFHPQALSLRELPTAFLAIEISTFVNVISETAARVHTEPRCGVTFQAVILA